MAEGRDESFEHTLAAPEGTPDFRTGTLFANRYEIIEVLGRGGMGAVFKVRDREVGEVVALKVLTVRGAEGSDAVERFRREIRLARRVTHRNVARTYDLGEHAGMRFLTMEHVDGVSLRVLIEAEGKVAPARAAAIALQIGEGLAAAHAAGVVHRDLKPANILLEGAGPAAPAAAGRAVVIDFGIARATQGDGANLQTMGSIGTPAYMAPEQVSGDPVDARTDVYAFGIILYEMLTGTLPFNGDTPISCALARLRDDPPDPRTLAPLPDALAVLVLRCLQREPAGRPPLDEVIYGLAAIAAAALAGVATDDTGTFPPGRVGSLAGGDLRSTPGSGRVATGPGGGGAAAGSGASAGSGRVATGPGSGGSGGGAGAGTGPGAGAGTGPAGTGRAGTSQSGRSLHLPTSPGDRALAVLPFRYRGPAEDAYLAEGLTEELIDVLSMTRGLRVSGSGATAKYTGAERDPRAVGNDLGVDAVVDGTLQRAGDHVKISARLVAVPDGFQMWTGRFEGAMRDVLELQETMAKRIAEALRLELAAIAARGDAPQEAVELYLRARQQAREFHNIGPGGSVDLLEQCLALAPVFRPALAFRAISLVKAWFVPQGGPKRDYEKEARAAVNEALLHAGGLAETHLAAAMVAVQCGDYPTATHALANALAIAPTCAEAHDYLGRLQVEAGKVDEGIRRLLLAVELDPALGACLVDVGRAHALHQRWDDYERVLGQLARLKGANLPPLLMVRVRVSLWRGDLERIRELIEQIPEGEQPFLLMMRGYCQAILGDVTLDDAEQRLAGLAAMVDNARFKTIMHQIACEFLSLRDRAEAALGHLERAVEAALIDIEWMERCPALAPLRGTPRFLEAERKVRRRAMSMWRA
ncbi:MAG TPA: protein kinase [Myxococcota bacterium]|nr:protein kinase [Myxococcota bacterium]